MDKLINHRFIVIDKLLRDVITHTFSQKSVAALFFSWCFVAAVARSANMSANSNLTVSVFAWWLRLSEVELRSDAAVPLIVFLPHIKT